MVVYFQELVSTVWVLLEIYDINLDNLHLPLIMNTDITKRASLPFNRPSTTQKSHHVKTPPLYCYKFCTKSEFLNTKKRFSERLILLTLMQDLFFLECLSYQNTHTHSKWPRDINKLVRPTRLLRVIRQSRQEEYI